MRSPSYWLISSLSLLVSGCALLDPDAISAGISTRRLRAKYGPFHTEKTIPFARIRADKQVAPSTSVFVYGDYSHGTEHSSQLGVDGALDGRGQALGAGISQDVTSFLSGEVSADVFWGKYSASGERWFLSGRVNGDFVGVGLFAGLGVDIPLSENCSIITRAGYYESFESASKGDFSFDGFSGFIGFEFSFP